MSNKDKNQLSIIIPVLNEADTLPALLDHLGNSADKVSDLEILVVDGGSVDNTKNVFKDFAKGNPILDLNWIASPKKGRAAQMNLGAVKARGDIFYFLHADSYPSKGFDTAIKEEVAKGNPAGCFRMQFDSRHWWLRLAGWFTRFNWKMCRGGDQSQFITRKVFDQIGGFDEAYKIFEDNKLIAELYNRKQFVVIPKTLTTSCRRYRKMGIWKLQYHFWMIHFKHKRGANPEHLYAYYRKHLAE